MLDFTCTVCTCISHPSSIVLHFSVLALSVFAHLYTCFLRTCIFHLCTVVLDFSILDYSTPRYLIFPYLHFHTPHLDQRQPRRSPSRPTSSTVDLRSALLRPPVDLRAPISTVPNTITSSSEDDQLSFNVDSNWVRDFTRPPIPVLVIFTWAVHSVPHL